MGGHGFQERTALMSERRFLVSADQLRSELVILEPAEAMHAQRVLRLREGDDLWLLDGLGNQALAVVERLNPMLCRVRERPVWQAPRPRVVMLLGIVKPLAMELLAQKLTELMVDEIRLFVAARSVAEAGGHKSGRWERLAGQALKQCGAARAPRFIYPPSSAAGLQEVLDQAPEHELKPALKILASEHEKQTGLPDLLPARVPESVWVIVGPEGGLTGQEIEPARARGFAACRLTGSILRSETAAIVLAGCLRCHWE
jgi:16S rRNA (uracil1498-N3)-methyltransferase